jgi:hypothetical protein
MWQSLVKNLSHLLGNTKHRELWIPTAARPGLHVSQAGIFKRFDDIISRNKKSTTAK